jgi:intein-encoded DNA endonuclease-like protein
MRAADVSKETGLQVSFLGKGAFRSVFKVENDTIIKLNIAKDSQNGKNMNQEDFELGTNARYGNIFPKAYELDPDQNWIILEQVTTLPDYFRISKYFPNEVIKSFRDPMRYYELFLESVRYVVGKEMRQQEFIDKSTEKINNISKLFLKALLKRDVSLEEIVNGFKQNSTFNDITSAIVRYNMDVNDALRPKNIGVGQDGRFVILDSSIKKSLEAGRETRA